MRDVNPSNAGDLLDGRACGGLRDHLASSNDRHRVSEGDAKRAGAAIRRQPGVPDGGRRGFDGTFSIAFFNSTTLRRRPTRSSRAGVILGIARRVLVPRSRQTCSPDAMRNLGRPLSRREANASCAPLYARSSYSSWQPLPRRRSRTSPSISSATLRSRTTRTTTSLIVRATSSNRRGLRRRRRRLGFRGCARVCGSASGSPAFRLRRPSVKAACSRLFVAATALGAAILVPLMESLDGTWTTSP